MVARIAWGERRFDFTFPVDFFPELIERLRGTPARVAARLPSVPADLVRRRVNGQWSMQEHAGHLGDLDTGLFLPRLDDYEAGARMLRPADMENAATERANHNARSLAEVLEHVRSARAVVVDRLERYDAAFFNRTAEHPRLGTTMRVVDMLYFQAEHDDYHLARITELIRATAPTAGG
ncbi:MAG TPA: DinB family protein [Gemmatimonadales bacterium]|nr:DinB family protein [Gemmatimonadales bacterium]